MTHTVNHLQLNKDIEQFPAVFPVTEDMKETFEGLSKLVMLDRYAYKDIDKKTLKEGDMVLLTVKDDPSYPVRGVGFVDALHPDRNEAVVIVEESYRASLEASKQESGRLTVSIDSLDKPMEIYYEQIAKRNANGLASVEMPEMVDDIQAKFYGELSSKRFVPAGRVLYGVGSDSEVTLFNCFIMPHPKDSRGGLAKHREEVMEIMSRGGGVGTNGSTLRPRDALARGVNGKSSGSVSWMNDLAQLTHLVSQGGSRRGAQMLIQNVTHPDIIEFIISKMQNPNILRFIKESTEDPHIKHLADSKLKFAPLSPDEQQLFETIIKHSKSHGHGRYPEKSLQEIQKKLKDGGTYTVHNPDFLTGANISVGITDDFMEAVEQDGEWTLRFPDIEHYTPDEMAAYDEQWHEVGDVREWEEMGYGVKTYRTVRAKDLWQLINICATYAAEPGIFFIDRANKETNAQAYGQKVVGTNPCGEQPLAPYSVCNLAAVNLAEMVNKETKEVDYDQLKETVRIGVRMQDNVIDSTPYFLEANKQQALGERRIGLGVMGLADLLIYAGKRYGSAEGNTLVDKVFETIALTAYETSIELAKEKGSFPFLVGETDAETQILREQFVDTGYMKRLPEAIRQGVLTHGIRNSHLLTVAPTGSTGTMVGVGTGLEPYFAFKYYRSGRLGKFIEVNADIVKEYLALNPKANGEALPDEFVSAMELTPEEHVGVQTTIQRWVDSSISKTVNAPKGYTVNQVADIYASLYDGGAKGGTVYVDGSRDSQVLSLGTDENDVAQSEAPESKVVTFEKKAVQKEAEEPSNTDGNDQAVGTGIGDICPVCRKGTVEDLGGCHTCTNCSAQLVCGL